MNVKIKDNRSISVIPEMRDFLDASGIEYTIRLCSDAVEVDISASEDEERLLFNRFPFLQWST